VVLKHKSGKNNQQRHFSDEKIKAPLFDENQTPEKQPAENKLSGANGSCKRLLDSVVNEAGEALAIVNLDNVTRAMKIIDINSQFERLFTCRRGEALGKNLLTLLQVANNRPSAKIAASSAAGASQGSALSSSGGKQGNSPVSVELTIRPFAATETSTASNDSADFLCILRHSNSAEQDITNIIAERVLSSMSHDLRTPLNGILGFSEIMMTEMLGPLGSKNYREYAEDIHGAGQDLLRAIDGLLNVSSSIQGELKPLDKKLFRVSDCISAALLKSDNNAVHRQIDIIQHYDAGLPPITADRDRLTDALSRVFSAALKRSTAQGIIRISAIRSAENTLEITCEDEGPELSQRELGQIFNPFPKASKNFVADGADLGIGFSLVKQTIEQHGGTVIAGVGRKRGLKLTMQLPISS
jgi:signal transduction histidine kinase